MKPKKVIKARRDTKGKIELLLSGNSSFTNNKTAIKMAERGEIQDVHVVKPKNKEKYLRTDPNKTSKDNLGEMANGKRRCKDDD